MSKSSKKSGHNAFQYYTLARKHLNISQDGTRNRVVALAAAEALQRPLPASKKDQYLLVRDYCQTHGLTRSSKRQASSNVWHPPTDPVASKDFLQSYEWRRLRMEVLIEQGRRCCCCGVTPKDGGSVNVDHIKPRRLFPDLALVKSNLQVLCAACNHGKGNWDQTDWRPAAPAMLTADDLAQRDAPFWQRPQPRLVRK